MKRSYCGVIIPLIGLVSLAVFGCNQQDNSKESEEASTAVDSASDFFTMEYVVPTDYQNTLMRLADERLGVDVSIPNDEASTVIREQWPVQSLKILGLEVRDGYQLTNNGMGTLWFTADKTGQRKFLEINRSIGIMIKDGTLLDESTKQEGEQGVDGDPEPAL